MSSHTKMSISMQEWTSASIGAEENSSNNLNTSINSPIIEDNSGGNNFKKGPIRVIIIGAGASGLSAGATLKKLIPTANVKLIEARDRIGGRIRTGYLPVETETICNNNTHQNGISNVKRNIMLNKNKACPIDLGAAYVHGCNITNPLFRQAKVNNHKLDTSKGGYSIGWGENCIWRSKDGRVIDKKVVKGAFKLAWNLKRDAEKSMLEAKSLKRLSTSLLKTSHTSSVDGLNTQHKNKYISSTSSINNNISSSSSIQNHIRLNLLNKTDICLRHSIDDIIKGNKYNKKYQLLNDDQKSILSSTEVLLWSYVASMNELSTRMLNEISIPLQSENITGDNHLLNNTLVKKSLSVFENEVSELQQNQEYNQENEVKNESLHDPSPPQLEKFPRIFSQANHFDSINPYSSEQIIMEEPTSNLNMFGKRSRRRKQTETFEPVDYISDKKIRKLNNKKDNINHSNFRNLNNHSNTSSPEKLNSSLHHDNEVDNKLNMSKLTWLDGLVSGGYFNLVCSPLSKGLNIELGRVVKDVYWEDDVCRVVSHKRRAHDVDTHIKKRPIETFNDASVPMSRVDGGIDSVFSSSTSSPTDSENTSESSSSRSSDNLMNNNEYENNNVNRHVNNREVNDDVQIDECDYVIIALPLGVLKGLSKQSKLSFHPELPKRKIEAIERIGFGSENKIILRFESVFWEEKEPYLQTLDERFRILNGLCFNKGKTLVFHTSPPFGKGYNGLNDDQVVEECMKVLRGMYNPPRCHIYEEKDTVGHMNGTASTLLHENDVFTHNSYLNQTRKNVMHDNMDNISNINNDIQPNTYGVNGSNSVNSDVVMDPVWRHVTRWDSDPFAMGAYSYWAKDMTLSHIEDIAKPEPNMILSLDAENKINSEVSYCPISDIQSENQVGVNERKEPDNLLIEPKLYFCGEHATIRDAQCVHGACNSGERAARQVACAAYGFLDDLHTCIQKGESFWYESSSSSLSNNSSPHKREFKETNDVNMAKDEIKTEFLYNEVESMGNGSLTGQNILFDEKYSPFPSYESAKWHLDGAWKFHCACGIKDDNSYDDGSSMVQCITCKHWQHVECSKDYMKMIMNRNEDFVNGENYECFQCYDNNEKDFIFTVKDQIKKDKKEKDKINKMNKSYDASVLLVESKPKKNELYLYGGNEFDSMDNCDHQQIDEEEDESVFESQTIGEEVLDGSVEMEMDEDVTPLCSLSNIEWKVLVNNLRYLKSILSTTAQTMMANTWIETNNGERVVNRKHDDDEEEEEEEEKNEKEDEEEDDEEEEEDGEEDDDEEGEEEEEEEEYIP